MTLILPGADIQAYYANLGIPLPDRSGTNATVRCFADPRAHARGDQNHSMSVSLATGAYRCHGCGASGGAYDAALTVGHSPRSAIELMIRDGLLEHRVRLTTARELITPATASPPDRRARPKPGLNVAETDVNRWQNALANRPQLLLRLARERGWRYRTMRDLQLGWDRGRITIPIRNADRELTGVLRYQAFRAGRPKMLALPGTELGLLPHPAAERSTCVVLVEGPPDMIAARSMGIPAIAVPGDHAWKDHWAELLIDRDVTILMDADDAGRAAAQRIHNALAPLTRTRIVDLAPGRSDGYDLTDQLLADPTSLVSALAT